MTLIHVDLRLLQLDQVLFEDPVHVWSARLGHISEWPAGLEALLITILYAFLLDHTTASSNSHLLQLTQPQLLLLLRDDGCRELVDHLSCRLSGLQHIRLCHGLLLSGHRRCLGLRLDVDASEPDRLEPAILRALQALALTLVDEALDINCLFLCVLVARGGGRVVRLARLLFYGFNDAALHLLVFEQLSVWWWTALLAPTTHTIQRIYMLARQLKSLTLAAFDAFSGRHALGSH